MPRPDLTDDLCSMEREEYAYEARMQRTRYHWCRDCLGHTGPGSPCAQDEPQDNEQESSDE